MPWRLVPVEEFDNWFAGLAEEDQDHIIAVTNMLEREGPSLRPPLSKQIRQPNGCDMRELRPASTGRYEIRLLYAFDRRRQAVLLLGGDKAGDWDGWYRRNVPLADARFDRHRVMLDSEEARHVADEPGRPRRRGRSKK